MIQSQSRYLDPLKWRRGLRLRPGFLLMGGLLSLFLLAACATENVRVGEVAQRPADRIGEQVRVQGEIEKSYGNRAFTIEDNEGEALFVIAEHPLALTQGLEGKNVEVTGTVRRFDRSEIERDLETELDSEVIENIEEGDPVIVAREVIGDEEEFEGMGGGRNLVDEPGLSNEFMDPKNELFLPNTHEPGR